MTARSISTNQFDVHEDLPSLVNKYKMTSSNYSKPYAQHTLDAFERCLSFLNGWSGEVILDACCGVGESTSYLSSQYSNAKVIGVDKSFARLNKHHAYQKNTHSQSYTLIQADLEDFWRLLFTHIKTNKPEWHILKQYIWYPNPYPKKSHLKKRWHGSPVFPYILGVSNRIEVRSNWLIYLREFELACEAYQFQGVIDEVMTEPLTPFERKYRYSGQSCYRFISGLGCER